MIPEHKLKWNKVIKPHQRYLIFKKRVTELRLSKIIAHNNLTTHRKINTCHGETSAKTKTCHVTPDTVSDTEPWHSPLRGFDQVRCKWDGSTFKKVRKFENKVYHHLTLDKLPSKLPDVKKYTFGNLQSQWTDERAGTGGGRSEGLLEGELQRLMREKKFTWPTRLCCYSDSSCLYLLEGR